MPDIETQLGELATAIDWPATPELAARVAQHLRTHGESRAATPPWWAITGGRYRWALAAAVLVAVAAALAYTPSRDALAGWINLHTIIQRVQQVPSPSPQPPGPLGKRLGLGSATTLQKAQRALAWKVALPSSLATPDEVYVQQPPEGPPQGEVTLVYASRPRIPVASQTGVAVLITEARGSVDANFFGKMIGQTSTFEVVTVAGHQGYWIAGAQNVFFFLDAQGNIRNETMRLAANVLILDDNGTIVRIEGNLTKAQALEIAGSL
ncbi:MAG TPA: hypothetical protein VGG90_13430 [Candidatus Dormibacteraeota bacterium]